eukprot:m.10008 g.10008  ORF g.10008 m.10008 type:complete len:110 (+) comp9559_c0_seq1:666-995(+)
MDEQLQKAREHQSVSNSLDDTNIPEPSRVPEAPQTVSFATPTPTMHVGNGGPSQTSIQTSTPDCHGLNQTYSVESTRAMTSPSVNSDLGFGSSTDGRASQKGSRACRIQ